MQLLWEEWVGVISPYPAGRGNRCARGGRVPPRVPIPPPLTGEDTLRGTVTEAQGLAPAMVVAAQFPRVPGRTRV